MKELKATKVLKNILNIADYGRYMEEQEIIKEAIKELEELNNRSCNGCKHYRPQDYDLKEDILDQWICCDEIYAETRDLVNFKKFYCSRYEAKGE